MPVARTTETVEFAQDNGNGPREKPAKTRKLHMIGNAHIDPVWLWQWQEGFHEVRATFRSALDRMQEYPEFVFVSSSAAFYEWVEQCDPAMFAEIQARVSEGRWGLVGGWWIQPDCNLPGGESFVRQGLYGQRYFRDRFGITATVGYNVDSFGHHAMLPQILKKSGLEAYVFLRPSPHEKGLPGRLFWWESDDASRVLAYRIPYEYCTWGEDLEVHVERCAAEARPPFDEQMCFYGVGNHGGGPTRQNLDSIRSLQETGEDTILEFSTPDRFFEAQLSKGLPIPTVHDELQHHASGCYAAHSGIKRWNRRAENLLVTAEKFATLASRITGQPYPPDLDRAWKNVLFNQFHDILAGTSLEAAYEDARDLYGEAAAIGGRALNLALQSLAWSIHIEAEEGRRALAVFNPHAWPVKANVEVEVAGLQPGEALLDPAGRETPYQQVQSQAAARGRSRVSFLADLPPLGYAVYRLGLPQPTESVPGPQGMLDATETSLENDRLRLRLDPETGCILSLWDKQAGLEVFAGPAARAVVLDDPSDTWGHNTFRFDRPAGEFRAREVCLVENGPVRATLRVTSEYGASTLVQDFSLYRELDHVEVRLTLDWREQLKALKLRFPLNLVMMRAVYEIPYGVIERFANGEEEPGQSWVDLSGVSRDTGRRYGLSLLNDGKYSFDVNVRDIGLTVLRSPVYANHMPVTPEPGGQYTYMDQGLQHFSYTLLPHPGSWEEAGTVRRAAELNQPPLVQAATCHPGPLPLRASFLSVDCPNVVVSALKQAEDGDGLILRCYETNRQAVQATLSLSTLGRTFQADFGPCEIKTFRIPEDAALPVIETNLLEF